MIHRCLLVDETVIGPGATGPIDIRRCLLCGHAYDRMAWARRLERDIRDRRRLPPSPWSAGERAEDCS